LRRWDGKPSAISKAEGTIFKGKNAREENQSVRKEINLT
jgi:hypothetical protein